MRLLFSRLFNALQTVRVPYLATEYDSHHRRVDSIDFGSIPGLNISSALDSIASTYADANTTKFAPRSISNVTDLIDVHVTTAHCVPDWYRAIVPTTGGNPTPSWNITSHLSFMSSQSISHAVLAFSSPGANVYPGNTAATTALARLINEQSAAYARAHPHQFAFYAVVPLPYTSSAIAEATYALDVLGAAGIALYSNFEGRYLGSSSFRSFFAAMDARGAGQIIYVHPTTPYLRVNGTLVEANPTTYPSGNIEFYFETARMLADLAVTQTLLNFTNLNYILPHVGGAFPSVADRLLKSYPALYERTLRVLQTRFYWDSAGPTYFHQVAGLLAYGIPTENLLFGTDFPYAPGFTYGPALLGIQTSVFVTDGERVGVFRENARRLFGGRIPVADE
ncbi:2-amino-3-carboxymuconate-6-semialdehyde decarboxylase [Pyrenophora seminiperda CCB06]|uniref:2-amino-3-carboxymuconate-6-semialdehyde decarboxylase n=1 Tax=Pyrenophora seminiperda CCB06 TaxID=1302712 RepID=A0A3M7MBT5_9PLEO|nr:2-amino-3-carboxymuconate-6-semialdehyde decarboxylase [Pyrenophora seminiperda CCB06]